MVVGIGDGGVRPAINLPHEGVQDGVLLVGDTEACIPQTPGRLRLCCHGVKIFDLLGNHHRFIIATLPAQSSHFSVRGMCDGHTRKSTRQYRHQTVDHSPHTRCFSKRPEPILPLASPVVERHGGKRGKGIQADATGFRNDRHRPTGPCLLRYRSASVLISLFFRT